MASIMSFWGHTQVKLLCIYSKIIYSNLFCYCRPNLEAGMGIILFLSTYGCFGIQSLPVEVPE